MKINKSLAKNLANAAEVMNVINGGMVFPTFNTTKETDHYRLEIMAPTIDPDNLKVEVNTGHLFIFHHLEVKGIKLPNMLGMMKLSAGVEIDNITAEYEADTLVVIIPFNELTGGFQKEIDILRH